MLMKFGGWIYNVDDDGMRTIYHRLSYYLIVILLSEHL